MKNKQLDWQKVIGWFFAFALAKIFFDWFFKDTMDVRAIIGIPVIALILIYMIDKERLMSDKE